MLLLWLLAVVSAPEARPQRGLTRYLEVAAAYRSDAAALQQIREWQPPEIASAIDALRRREDRLCVVPRSPDEIAFGTVEAAVLMHADAGLLSLQQLSLAEAEFHLRASTTLLEWSRRAAAGVRERAALLRAKLLPSSTPPLALEANVRLRERIDRVEFYKALAAAALAMGFPATARPFAETARRAAPLSGEVQLVFGCVTESLADELRLRHRESEATRLREEAGNAMLDALAIDAGLLEARLRLGRLLLVGGHLIEAEAPLEDVERLGDDRQRYLARLLLGRLAEERDRRDDAIRFYAAAVEGWPDSQAARLALAHALERESGPAAARVPVAATLAASRRLDRVADPWWLYPFGPPGLAAGALERVWKGALGR